MAGGKDVRDAESRGRANAGDGDGPANTREWPGLDALRIWVSREFVRSSWRRCSIRLDQLRAAPLSSCDAPTDRDASRWRYDGRREYRGIRCGRAGRGPSSEMGESPWRVNDELGRYMYASKLPGGVRSEDKELGEKVGRDVVLKSERSAPGSYDETAAAVRDAAAAVVAPRGIVAVPVVHTPSLVADRGRRHVCIDSEGLTEILVVGRARGVSHKRASL